MPERVLSIGIFTIFTVASMVAGAGYVKCLGSATVRLRRRDMGQKMRFWYLVALLLSAMVAPCPGLAESRVALVIGNGSYQNVPALPNPVNDAGDLSASLGRLGFNVRTLKNATFDEMRRALISFGQQARGAEIAVIFFAGHGIETGGENWLIPIDAQLATDLDIANETIGLKPLTMAVANTTRLGLVILDACRNNPFMPKMQRTSATRTVDRGLVRVEPNDNVLVAYAARDGTTAGDGSGRNSPFTNSLLRHIETPGLEVTFLFRHVRDEVMAATNRQQQPFMYGSLSKDVIYLKAAPVASSGEPPEPQTRPSNSKSSDQDDASSKLASAKEYLAAHPELLEEFAANLAERQAAEAAPARQQAAVKSNSQLIFHSPRDVVLGNKNGDVTFVEFFDYNCGFCKRSLADMTALLKTDPKLKVVLKEFPILGPGSVEASEVAVAVRMQDPTEKKYLDFHQKLLGGQGKVDKVRAMAVAKEVGLDMAKLANDMASPEVQATIAENTKLGEELKLIGTPSYVIGKEVIGGAVGLDELSKKISVARCGSPSCMTNDVGALKEKR